MTILNTLLGVKSIDEVYFRAARSLGFSDPAILFHVIVPGAMPYIFVGLQIAMGACWFSLVASEIVSGQAGLGYKVWETYYYVQYETMVIVMATLGSAWLRIKRACARGGQPADALARPHAGWGVAWLAHRHAAASLSIRHAGKVYDPDGANVVALDDVSLRDEGRRILRRRRPLGLRQNHAAELDRRLRQISPPARSISTVSCITQSR